MEATRGAALSSAPTGNPIVPDSPRSSESRSRGGRSTAGSPARARCSAWEIGRSGRARSRKRQHAPHRAGRGEEARREGQGHIFLSAKGGFVECSSTAELSHGSIKKSAFGTTLSRSR